MHYYDNVTFPEDFRAIVDVTKPPYCVDNTGKTDCTGQLRKILDDMLLHTLDGLRETEDLLRNHTPEETRMYSSGVRKVRGKINMTYPRYLVQAPSIYFPAGIYLVSDTVTYTLKGLQNLCYTLNINGTEINWCIRFIGQDRDKTVIRLQDKCAGFGPGGERAVVNFMNGEWSNMAMSNYFENLTIDIGSGNPGAIGLIFNANNSGSVRHVRIVSSAPSHEGAIGLYMKHEYVSAFNVRDLEVDGFDYGVKLDPVRNYASLEDIRLTNQLRCGINIRDTVASVRKLNFHGNRPAVYVNGTAAHVVLTDSVLSSDGTEYEAIRIDRGVVYVHNTETKGFSLAIRRFWGQQKVKNGLINNYSTHDAKSLSGQNACTLGLAVPELPDVGFVSFDSGKCVNDFGATGDGVHDDTKAIQAAFSSGLSDLWFLPGRYLISDEIKIPSSVKHINFMFCDLAVTDEMSARSDAGVFRIVGTGNELLFIERLFTFNECTGLFRMFVQENTRPLYLRDMHTQSCAMYRNIVPGGDIYLENTACTIGWHDREEYFNTPCFEFIGKNVWAHSVNPERSRYELINNAGLLWVHGFKCESDGTVALTLNGGTTEILGGISVHGYNSMIPCIENNNSSVSAIFSTGGSGNQPFPLLVSETYKGGTRGLGTEGIPEREAGYFVSLPLYSGICKENGEI